MLWSVNKQTNNEFYLLKAVYYLSEQTVISKGRTRGSDSKGSWYSKVKKYHV